MLTQSSLAQLDVVAPSATNAILERLTTLSDRIRTLCVNTHSLRGMKPIPFPSLRRLVIVAQPYEIPDDIKHLLPTLRACENLQLLQFPVTEQMALDDLAPIFKRLKRCKLTVPSTSNSFIHSLLSLFQDSSELTWLCVKCFPPWSENMDSWSPSSLPGDGVINLTGVRQLVSEFLFTLESVSAPNASYWAVNTGGWPTVPDPPLFTTFDLSSTHRLYVRDRSNSHPSPFCIYGSPEEETSECPNENLQGEFMEDFVHSPYNLPERGFHIQLDDPEPHLKAGLSLILPLCTNLIDLRLLLHYRFYDFREVLHSVPSVRKLIIERGVHPAEFFMFLSEPSILPRLNLLVYSPKRKLNDDPSHENIIGQALVDCLSKREESLFVHQLEFIRLHRCPSLGLEWMSELNVFHTLILSDVSENPFKQPKLTGEYSFRSTTDGTIWGRRT